MQKGKKVKGSPWQDAPMFHKPEFRLRNILSPIYAQLRTANSRDICCICFVLCLHHNSQESNFEGAPFNLLRQLLLAWETFQKHQVGHHHMYVICLRMAYLEEQGQSMTSVSMTLCTGTSPSCTQSSDVWCIETFADYGNVDFYLNEQKAHQQQPQASRPEALTLAKKTIDDSSIQNFGSDPVSLVRRPSLEAASLLVFQKRHHTAAAIPESSKILKPSAFHFIGYTGTPEPQHHFSGAQSRPQTHSKLSWQISTLNQVAALDLHLTPESRVQTDTSP
jgi:hypothetical protein